MNLKKRLTIFTVLVVIITSGSVGLALIENSHKNQVSRVESELSSIINTVNDSQVDKVTLALALSDASQSNISLFLSDENGEIYSLSNNSNESSELLTIKDYLASKGANSPNSILIQQVSIEGGLKLILSASIQSFHDERNSELVRFLIYLSIASLLALVILRRVISQDVARESKEIVLNERLKYEESRRKMLLEFASDTSHELRTPLTVIRGYLDLIRKRADNTIDDPTLNKLTKETIRLDQSISNLLTMLELEALEDESLVTLNLSEIIQDEVSSFKILDSQRDVRSSVEENIWIRGSEELILKLVRNILSNIRRHATADAPVQVSLKAESNTVAMIFEDGGPLAETQSLKIDDYLTRFNSSRSLSKGGSGLGFSIMSKTVEKLSGEISLFHSQLGGLGISIKLPRL